MERRSRAKGVAGGGTEPPTLTEKVRVLAGPDVLPGSASGVEAIETHMAWVFLAGESAYKLKKPVRRELLDASSLEARRRLCDAEVRLNRRLAPEVYLGVVPLVRRGEKLALGEPDEPGEPGGPYELGEVVEWLVHMRRLPRERMLDRCIAAGKVDQAEARRAAQRLADFYAGLPSEPIEPAELARRFERDARTDAAELLKPRFALPAELVRRIESLQLAFLGSHADLLELRVEEGRIVEGHGDLRPEHVCLLPDPVVIDCLEFDRDLRVLDWADDVAFLALECERMGAPELGAIFLSTCAAKLRDRPPERLLAFYRGHRAFLRAKIAVWHLLDPEPAPGTDWPARAQSLLALAGRHLEAATRP